MATTNKSTVEQIRTRFDNEVERFSNLQTGQSATIDAPLVLDLISSVASSVTPGAKALLDVGCGAGNYSLKLLERLPDMDVTLVDLSGQMLLRAKERVGAATGGVVRTVQGDIREIELGSGAFDIVTAAAVLHHLRTDDEYRAVFAKFYAALRPGGSIWISDLVTHESPEVQTAMWRRYGEYLTGLKNEAYRDEVYNYIEAEDTPRPLTFQLGLLREAGFKSMDVLHKNSCFAAFGAIK